MKTRVMSLAAVLWLVTVSLAAAQVLPTARPEQVGLSSERLVRITTWLGTDVEKGQILGVVLLIARHGKIAYFEALGTRDPQSKQPMTKDTISASPRWPGRSPPSAA